MSEEHNVKLGCLDIALQISKLNNNYCEKNVVNIATVLYDFIIASPHANKLAERKDKPNLKKSSGNMTDILS